MANQELVSVGRVFELFPGSKGITYYGIEVTSKPFRKGQAIIFRGQNGGGDIKARIGSIELDRRKVNVALKADGQPNEYGVRLRDLPAGAAIAVGDEVLIYRQAAEAASRMTLTQHSRRGNYEPPIRQSVM
ncbi:MAG: hypothetical protein WCV50_05450 [Patescibacteria group bacterium]|jgi:hypothetical protein